MLSKTKPVPRSIAGLAEMAARYDHFIIDQFGVLHDGQAPYPGAVEALSALKSAGKQVLLLSNSGKRATPNEARLIRLGFPQGSWDHFLSSGELAWSRLAEELPLRPERAKCLLIARDGDTSAVEGLPLELVADGASADFILLAASQADSISLEDYAALLAPAAENQVPCCCTNPDQIMLTKTGPRHGAGRIADLYAELGGQVQYIGKPYPEIYRIALHRLGDPAPDRVLCIGDSIEHDITGGQRAGLATLLVRTGVLSDLSQSDLLTLCQHEGATPDYVLANFNW